MTISRQSYILLYLSLLLCGGGYSCKPAPPEATNVSSYRSGSYSGNSCRSNSVYQKRIKQQLEYMGSEFLAACNSQVRSGFSLTKGIAGKSMSKFDGSMWNYDSQNFDAYSIFRTRNRSMLGGGRKSSPHSPKESELAPRFLPGDYIYLPKIFQTSGALGHLKILESLSNERESIHGGGRSGPGKIEKWRSSLDSYSSECKMQLITMRERALTITRVANEFYRDCCKDKGGIDESKGILSCKIANSLQEPDGERYFEWPVCGSNQMTTCSQRNLIGYDGGSCARCELRLPIPFSGKKFYLPRNPEKGVAYDLDLAEKTRITCLSPSASRNAIATWCVNSDHEFCKGYNYRTDVKDIYRGITPYLHCTNAEITGQLAESQKRVASGGMSWLYYGHNTGVGGEFSAKGSIGVIVKASGGLFHSTSAASRNVLELRSSGTSPTFVYRSGRFEIGGRTKMHCAKFTENSSCSGAQLGIEVGGDIGIADGSVAYTRSISNCATGGAMSATDWGGLPYLSGLTLSQAADACQQYTENDKTHSKKLLLMQLLKTEFSDISNTEFFKLDLSKRNLYCMTRPIPERKISDAELLRSGTNILEIYLQNKGKDQYYIGLRGPETKLFDSKLDFDRKSIIEDYSHEKMSELLDPTSNNETILRIIDELMRGTSTRFDPRDRLRNSMQDQECRFLKRPTTFKFKKPGLQCYVGKNDQMTDTISLRRLSLENISGNLKIVAFEGDRPFFEGTKPGQLFGTLLSRIDQGAIDDSDAIGAFQSMYRATTYNTISCIESAE